MHDLSRPRIEFRVRTIDLKGNDASSADCLLAASLQAVISAQCVVTTTFLTLQSSNDTFVTVCSDMACNDRPAFLLCAKLSGVLLHHLLVAGVHEHGPACLARINFHKKKDDKRTEKGRGNKHKANSSLLALHVLWTEQQ